MAYGYGFSVRLVLGSDEEAPLVDQLTRRLGDMGHEVARVAVGLPWTEVGHAVGEAVALGEYEMGIVCCWTGTGVSIAANKVPGARAALCVDAATAADARRWNDANVLALSIRLTSAALAGEIVDAFLAGEAEAAERPIFEAVEVRPVVESGGQPG